MEPNETSRTKQISNFIKFVTARLKKGGFYGIGFSIAFVIALSALFLFLFIASGYTGNSEIEELDTKISNWVFGTVSSNEVRWIRFVTDLGGTRGTAVGVLIVGVLLLITRRWWSLFGLLMASGIGGIILSGLKLFFRRARPIESLVGASGYAFPSGHAFAAVVFFGYLIYMIGLYIKNPLLKLFLFLMCFIMMAAISASRIFLNVHWFTDVSGGILAGIIWLMAVIYIIRTIEHLGSRRKHV